MARDEKASQKATGSYIAQALGKGAQASVTIYQWFLFNHKTEIDEETNQNNRQAVLKAVKDIWIATYLKTSLYGADLIDLGMTKDKIKLVDNPHSKELSRVVEQTAQNLPPGTKIADVFEDEGQALIILGAPGLGKTTMLLSLARDTIEQAKKGDSKPMPVVLNLSSWGEKQPAFNDWLVDELTKIYGVPEKQGRYWIERNDLLLLLDGLDEVASDKRESCVAAINSFYEKHKLTIQMAVCCRKTEYEALTTRLQLKTAIVLQPLELKQIETYLLTLSKAAIRPQLSNDVTTEQLFTFCYNHPDFQAIYPQLKPDKNHIDNVNLVLDFITHREQLDALLSSVKVVDEFQELKAALQQDSTLQELAKSPLMLSVMSLAYQGAASESLQGYATIEARSKHLWNTYIDRMIQRQYPDKSKRPYTNEQTKNWLGWLAQKLKEFNQTEFFLEDLYPYWLDTELQMHIFEDIGRLLFGLLGGLLVGLLVGIVISEPFGELRDGLIVGAPIGLFTGLSVWIGSWKLSIIDQVKWSWKKAIFGLLGGLLIGTFVGTVFIVMITPGFYLGISLLLAGMLVAPFFGLIGALKNGIEVKIDVETRKKPNEGIWRTLKFGFFKRLTSWISSFFMGGLLISFIAGVFFSSVFRDWFNQIERDAMGIAMVAFLVSLLVGGVLNWLAIFVRHFLLRFVLYKNDCAPWQYVPFLDYADKCILLHKRRNHYAFYHISLREHFVEMYKTDKEDGRSSH